MPKERLRGNLEKARGRIERAAQVAGRDPGEIQLLPVTKSVSAGTIANLLELGETQFGENRADVLEAKGQWFASQGAKPVWHFIGPLQRNKARRVLGWASVFHSVDSLRLIETLARIGSELDASASTPPAPNPLHLFLQVWLSGESQKQGFPPEEVDAALMACAQHSNLVPVGLMTMGPTGDKDGHDTRGAFETLARLAGRLQADPSLWDASSVCRLSMGMSGDLEWAVAAGSHLVRVGTDLYR